MNLPDAYHSDPPPGRPSLRPPSQLPGTLTAVPNPDHIPSPSDAPAKPPTPATAAARGLGIPKDCASAPAPVPPAGPGVPRPTRIRPKSLAELAGLLGLQAQERPAEGPGNEAQVTGITHDSRAVLPGDLYAALPGARFHGADFIEQAAARGAVAVLTDQDGADRVRRSAGQEGGAGAPAGPAEDFRGDRGPRLPLLVVTEPRKRIGALAAAIYDHPGEDLLQIGVTGTSGKTTTVFLIDGGLRAAHGQARTGLVGTVETRAGEVRIRSEHTTPEATDLQALFAVMREHQVTSVAVEVSSHALVLGRVDGVRFDVAVFTNLSPEHLDFHPDMEDYYRAKAALFTPERAKVGVVNLDDEYGRRLAAEASVPVVTYSAAGNPDAAWRAEQVVPGPASTSFTVVGPDGVSAPGSVLLPGAFNVANALAAVVALVTAGIPVDRAVAGVASVSGVPGRLEGVDAGQPYLAVVDYAHKPDALRSVLHALRKVTKGKIHVVVGCGGDRDPHKRGAMGAAAAALADTAFLTSDNPRSEDPLEILTAMLSGAAGVPSGERGEVVVEPNRAAAVAAAVARARPGDTVLIAGKGHEQGQDTAGVVRPFDDREVLRDAITRSSHSSAE